jgi:hypothetical protein
MNGDDKCYDQTWMNKIWNGPTFGVPGDAMVWSFGPYKICDPTQPITAPINQNIVASWK